MRNLYESKEQKYNLLNVSNTLGNAPLSEIKPILLKSFEIRSNKLCPPDLIKQYHTQYPFLGPSSLNQRDLVKFDNLFYSVVPEYFDAVEFSPISPLGTNSVITKVSQNNVLSTIRGSEVVADSTTPLAIEIASRRKLKKNYGIEEHLASSLRIIRLQPFDQSKGYRQHFRLLGLCSSGKEIPGTRFYRTGHSKHINIWLSFLEKLSEEGMEFNNVSVDLSDINVLEKIIKSENIPREDVQRNSLNEEYDLFEAYSISFPKKVKSISEIDNDQIEKYGLENYLDTLSDLEDELYDNFSNKFKNVSFEFDFSRKAGLGYYCGSCFHIFAENQSNDKIQLADGGEVDWVAKLTNNYKERTIISGLGSELILNMFNFK